MNIKIKATNPLIDVSYFFSFKSFLKIFFALKDDAGKTTLRGFCCRFIDTLTLKMDAKGEILLFLTLRQAHSVATVPLWVWVVLCFMYTQKGLCDKKFLPHVRRLFLLVRRMFCWV